MRIHQFILAAAVAFGVLPESESAAEVFRLKNGGEVEGEWLNPNESPRKRYIIRTRDGGQLALPTSAVHAPRRMNDAERKYHEIRSKFDNTVEAQWQLAEFCRTNGLADLRKVHLRQILEIDPDHDAARVALGYTRDNETGKWTTQRQKMTDQGYFFHAGAYRTRQEIAVLEERQKIVAARNTWKSKLKKWRGWLNSRRRAEEAKDLILDIDDPYAVDAIGDVLEKERSRAVKLLMIDALTNIKGHAPIYLLARISLDDADSEVRLVAREQLERLKSPAALDYFIRELKSKDNKRINRAASGLESLDQQSAVRPLIEALVTKHQFKVVRGKPGQLGGTFGSGGGGTFSSGGSVKIETKQLQNTNVLEALRELTGVDFGYNVDGWRRWYASKRKLDFVNSRRDAD
ncbi:MAG: hypothetical protein MI757_02555 [Pirellulales bacterium]|nr:hypothetical protein [Pirellulales bacterium]